MCVYNSFHHPYYVLSPTRYSKCFGSERQKKKKRKADPENAINIIYFEIDTAQFSG